MPGRWYGEKGYEHSAGSCTNADGSPFSRGQETFFDLEQRAWNGWDAREEGDTVRFQLFISDEMDREKETNQLTCCYGDTVHITLTGSAEQGYTIARTDK